MKIDKLEEVYFKCKPEKFVLLKKHAEKQGIQVECVVNIPKITCDDFERFLIENDILEEE